MTPGQKITFEVFSKMVNDQWVKGCLNENWKYGNRFNRYCFHESERTERYRLQISRTIVIGLLRSNKIEGQAFKLLKWSPENSLQRNIFGKKMFGPNVNIGVSQEEESKFEIYWQWY